MTRIYFWQVMITPHISSLALELSKNGYEIFYVSQIYLSKDRMNIGWEVSNLGNVKIHMVKNLQDVNSIISNAHSNSIHICQGIRNNGLIYHAQKEIRKKKLRQWVIMETVNDNGFFGFIKRILYKYLIKKYQKDIEIILAIGWRTSDWLIKLGMESKRVFPFTYFLQKNKEVSKIVKKENNLLSFIFIGSLVKNKKVDLLILALSKLSNYEFELIVVGDGPERRNLQKYAEVLIPGRTVWKGTIKMRDINNILFGCDCLVLPSIHDGWGAVVSEAMINGVPAVCSDTCGAAEVVKLSGYGGVFKSKDLNGLIYQLHKVAKKGSISEKDRSNLSSWSKKITSEVGSEYLLNIINYSNGVNKKPIPPWIKK